MESTFLHVYGARKWLKEKHDARSRRSWRKLHLALDPDIGEIIAHILTDHG
ncbi:transposase [Mesorhizobium sp. M5C.F.Cr.IN.023.01.1.1]|uniref:transposase n=1 Tax=Mesorhizobium sp. M5C.F.Cr.IN.023.01.1.1 TaxID=2496768 RepID=UPI0013E28EF8|nr:transposase [Mesorhizobium sp. M5C.F.Cr.IN.023.01.1.1]